MSKSSCTGSATSFNTTSTAVILTLISSNLLHLFIYLAIFFSLVRFLPPCSCLDTDAVHPFHKLEAQLPSALLEELFGITLLIGRLKDLPAGVQSAFTMSNQGKVCITCDGGRWGGVKKTPTVMNTRVVIKKRK